MLWSQQGSITRWWMPLFSCQRLIHHKISSVCKVLSRIQRNHSDIWYKMASSKLSLLLCIRTNSISSSETCTGKCLKSFVEFVLTCIVRIPSSQMRGGLFPATSQFFSSRQKSHQSGRSISPTWSLGTLAIQIRAWIALQLKVEIKVFTGSAPEVP